jgi:hypothetical protein
VAFDLESGFPHAKIPMPVASTLMPMRSYGNNKLVSSEKLFLSIIIDETLKLNSILACF